MPETAKQKSADEAAAADKSARDAAAAEKTAVREAAAAEKAAASKNSTAAVKPASKKKKTRDVAILRVTGPARGRRRCGHAFGAEPVDLRVEDLTMDEVAAIQSDPQLISAGGTRSEEIEGDDA